MSLTDHKALIFLAAQGATSTPSYLMCYDFDTSTWSELTKPCNPRYGTDEASIVYDRVNEIVYWYGTSDADSYAHFYKSLDFGASWTEISSSPFTKWAAAATQAQIAICDATGRVYLWGRDGTDTKLGYYRPQEATPVVITDNLNSSPLAAAQEATILVSPITESKLWMYGSSTAFYYNNNSGDKDNWTTYNLGQEFTDIQPSRFDDTVLYGVKDAVVFKLTGNGATLTTLSTTAGMDGARIWEDQANSNILYVGDGSITAKVPAWISIDGGATFSPATGDLTAAKSYAMRNIVDRWGYGQQLAAIVQGTTSPEAYNVWLAWTTDGTAWTTSKITGVADWSKIATVATPAVAMHPHRIVFNDPVIFGPVTGPEIEPPTDPEPEVDPPDPPDPPDPIYTAVVRPTSSDTLLVYDEGHNGWYIYDGLPTTAVSWNPERRHIVLCGDGVIGSTAVKSLCGLYRYGLSTHMDVVLSMHGLGDEFKYKRVRHVELLLKGDAKVVAVHWEFGGNEVSGTKSKDIYTATGKWYDSAAGTSLATDVGEEMAYFSDDESGGTFTRPIEKKYRFVCPQGGMGLLTRVRIETEGEGEITDESLTINFFMAP